MNQDDRRFFAYEIHEQNDMRLTTAALDRDWMDASDQRAAYRCLPLTIANQAGWILPNPAGFTALWDGDLRTDHLLLTFDPPAGAVAPDPFGVSVVGFGAAAPVHRDPRITSHFGSGVITFSLPYLFRTPRGVNLWVKGPSNYFKDGAQPLEGVVETDWVPATFTMNWKLTRPGYPVRFQRGEPICMVVPVPRGLAEGLEPVYAPLSANPDLERDYREWERSRAAFGSSLLLGRPEAVRRGWQRDYMKGLTPSGERAEEHQTRLALREFTRAEEGGAAS